MLKSVNVICENGMILFDMVNKEIKRGRRVMPNQMSKLMGLMLNNLHFLESESDVSTIYNIFSRQPVESVWQYHSPIMELLLSPYVFLQRETIVPSHMLYNVVPFLTFIRVRSPLASGDNRLKGFLSQVSPSVLFDSSLHRH